MSPGSSYMITSPWSLSEWDDGFVPSDHNPVNPEVPLMMKNQSTSDFCHCTCDKSSTGFLGSNINPSSFQSSFIPPEMLNRENMNINQEHQTGQPPCVSFCNLGNFHFHPPSSGMPVTNAPTFGSTYQRGPNHQFVDIGGSGNVQGQYQYSQEKVLQGQPLPFAVGFHGIRDRQYEGGFSPSSATGTNTDWDMTEWNLMFDSPGGSGGLGNITDRATLEGMCERGGAFLVKTPDPFPP